MNRRSLLFLCGLLALACTLLIFALRPEGPPGALDAQGIGNATPHEDRPEAQLQAVAGSEARSADTGPGLGTPHTPARDELGAEHARVAGFLRAQEDRPWRNASVALVVLDGFGRPQLLAEENCTSYGGFSIECERSGRALFVVLARGFAPRTLELELVHGREQLLEDFELERGLAIEGSLTSNRRALARFEVVAVDERDLERLRTKNGELLWNGSTFDWRYTIGESGADGRYAIGGLRAGEYEVRVATCRGPLASLCSGDRSPRTIRAPQAGVDFDFESSSLALKFVSAGEPLADVEVELESGNWRSGKKSDAQGECRFELVPRLDCRFVATKAGYEDLQLPVTAPASGASAAESFEMRAKPAAPQLHFLVSGSATDEAPATLRLRLFPLPALVESAPQLELERKTIRFETAPAASEPGAPPPIASLDRILNCTPASARLAVKDFVLPDAPTGRFRAVLIPGQPFNNELEPASYIGTHCPVQRVLEIQPAGEQRIAIVAERRPALRLELPDAAGQRLPGRCTLRDDTGQELPIVLVDPALGIPLLGHELSTAGPTLLYSTFDSGMALLSVEHEGKTLYQGSCGFRRGLVMPVDLRR